MIETILTYSGYFLSLFLIILFHEGGHYLTARFLGLHVDKFYIFLNPWFSVFKFKFRNTEYGLGWLPAGGYIVVDPHLKHRRPTEQIIFYVGGIIGNIILFGLIGALYPALPLKDWFAFTGSFSLALAAVNALPIKPMDGYRIYKILSPDKNRIPRYPDYPKIPIKQNEEHPKCKLGDGCTCKTQLGKNECGFYQNEEHPRAEVKEESWNDILDTYNASEESIGLNLFSWLRKYYHSPKSKNK